ncbi:hypothetical protein EPI10_028015 [Gossypium australe]|uniref:Secreted protein n=1 Tax=Gossypium australe TaxID=47621 RepID=A0A5B6UXU1_9ROSI|nr:hypothetical protein EPI10_028015 [Gossypium australe]
MGLSSCGIVIGIVVVLEFLEAREWFRIETTPSHSCIISDMCRISIAWCVGLGGCFKPYMVCRDDRRWCVEVGGRTLLSDLHICIPQS